MTLYREGYEYAVCDECGSHVLLTDEERLGWRDVEETAVMLLTCDWDPCQADFAARVHPLGEATPP